MTIIPLRSASIALLATPFLLAACGGGNGSNTPDVGAATNGSSVLSGLEVRRLGLVIAATITQGEESITEHLSRVHARFEEYQSPPTTTDFSELEEIVSLPLGCTVEDDTFGENVESDYDLFFVEPASEGDSSAIGRGEAISAGDALTLMTPVGSWPDLLPTTYFRSGLSYSLDYNYQPENIEEFEPTYYPDRIPAGSTLDIPGDEFPAFSSLSIGGLPPVRGVSIEGTAEGELQASSIVRWTAGDNPERKMAVTFNSDIPFESDYKRVTCITLDDGNFEVPPEARALMNDHIFPADETGVSRVSSHYRVSGDTLLVILNMSLAN